MNKRILLTALWIAVLLAGLVSPAQAQAAISGVSPVEGTVGTVVTISGAGFGVKQGEVLIGVEKCKVLEWSDGQITCEVHKPQAPGEYTLTVLRQGDKKPADPLDFSYFAMRQPKMFPGELAQEGGAVTVLGAFFGDKKGDIRIGYVEGGAGGEVVIDKQKTMDWSMNAIRFEIPSGLVGKFVLKVSNQVGVGYALLDLGGETPLLGDIPAPPGWPEGQGIEAANPGGGVWFKGKFYVFYPAYDQGASVPQNRCKIFNPATGGFGSCPGGMPDMYTEVTPETVVVRDADGKDKELWLFHVTGSKTILFSRFDGSNWLWIRWAGGLSQTPPVLDWYVTDRRDLKPAAVFNPLTLKVTLYITYQTHINFATSSDGVTWTHSGAVYPYSDSSLSAVYHQGSVNGNPYDTLLAFRDNINREIVYYLKDGGVGGVVGQYILNDPAQSFHILDLVNLDNDPAGGVAMLYLDSPNSAAMRTLGTNGGWSAPTTVFTLPDEDWCQYYFSYSDQVHWPWSSAALIHWPDGTRRIMFLYLYATPCALNYFKMLDVRTLY